MLTVQSNKHNTKDKHEGIFALEILNGEDTFPGTQATNIHHK